MNSNNEVTELEHQIQTTRTLIKASVFAALLAITVLTLVILPAEYNIDPTGAGAFMGLTQMYTASPASSEKPAAAGPESAHREDNVDITVPAGKGIEYKFHLLEGETMRYDWSTIMGELFYDFHGEPKGDTTGYFESYTVSTANKARGSFTAPFEGSHGWYWKNSSRASIVVSLKTEGRYEIIGIK